MKSLNDYIKESILSDWEDIDVEKDVKKSITEDFIKSNYKITGDIQFDHYNNGKWVVNIDGHVKFINMDLKKLTNGLFEFGKVGKNFYCHNCKSLKTLEGAPKEVGEDFWCYDCKSLKTLEGAPEKVGGGFNCNGCDSLTSLKGAPKEVEEYFDCSHCKSLKTLEGAPEKVGDSFNCSYTSIKNFEGAPEKVGYYLDCDSCKKLTSFKGLPKEIGDSFYCRDCKKLTDIDCGYKPEIKDSIYMADSGKGRGCAFSISDINQCMKVIGSIYIK